MANINRIIIVTIMNAIYIVLCVYDIVGAITNTTIQSNDVIDR